MKRTVGVGLWGTLLLVLCLSAVRIHAGLSTTGKTSWESGEEAPITDEELEAAARELAEREAIPSEEAGDPGEAAPQSGDETP